jgi:putative SOS response-associated peptidase YedK
VLAIVERESLMCGRYIFYEYQELSERLTNVSLDTAFFEHFNPTWNAAPTQDLPVIVEDDEIAAIRAMTWGLIPRWTKPGERPKVAPINARSETLAQKPMFRSLIKSRRCVVPSNGFYEWKKTASGKQPYLIEPTNGQLMLFAGLYDEARTADGAPLESFTIVTTSSNDTMSDLHDRMPVILDEEDVEAWLDSDLNEFEPLEHLLRPAPDDAIRVHPVSRAVNNARHNGPDLIEPLEDDDPA